MKRATRYIGILLFVVLALAFLVSPEKKTEASVYKTFNYQGKLLDNAGVAVANGNYSVYFLIYDDLAAGSCLWSARGTCGVPTAKTIAVSGGIFSTMLGEAGDTTLPDFTSDSYYLEVRIDYSGTPQTLSPRKRIGSVPQALNANALVGDGVINLTSSATGTNAAAVTVNSLTTGNGLLISSSSLSSGALINLTQTGTAAASNTQAGLKISMSGANAATTQTTYGSYISNIHTGTASTNIGLYTSASGGTNNYGLIVENGSVGIGTTAPTEALEVSGDALSSRFISKQILNGFNIDSANSDTVEAGGYDAISTGGANWGSGTTERHFLNNYQKSRIRENGSMTRVSFYLASKPAAITAFYIEVWRKDGSTWDRISQEDIWSLTTGGTTNTITLATPVAVREGDYIGYGWTSSSSPGSFLTAISASGSASYYITDTSYTTTDYDWSAGSTNTFYLPIKAYMQAPMMAFIGDSIMAGHPGHYSFIEATSTTNIGSSIEYNLGNALNYTYQNMGIGSQTTTNIAARFTTDVVNLKPKIAVIEGGVNDIATSVPIGTFNANWTTMLNACQSNNIIPVVVLILPWTDGTTVQMQTRDTWNASLTSIAQGYSNAIIVDASAYVGQYRPGGDAGNLWDIRSAYNADGVHYNSAGHARIAQAIADAIAKTTVKGGAEIGSLLMRGLVDFSGESGDRAISVQRNPVNELAGAGLNVTAGGASILGTDRNGGTLTLSSGTSTGTGTSRIAFYTAAAGSTGTADNAPAEAMSIGGNGYFYFGSGLDTNLYRSAASTLATDDLLKLANGITNPTTSSYGLTFGGAAAGTADVNLYRSAANYLKTDDSLVIASPNVTGTTTSSGLSLSANSLTTGTGLYAASSTLSSGSLVNLAVTGTAADANTQKALNISTSGANAGATQTTYGGYISNTHTGTTSTNVGLYSTASGATNNYAAIFDSGNVGIGTTTPSYALDVAKTVKAGTAFYGNARMLDFDGSNDNVNLGDIAELNSATNFTISMWFKQDVLDTVDILFNKYLGPSTTYRIILLTSTDGNMYFAISDSGVKQGYFDYSTAVTAGRWHHLAAVYDGAGTGNAGKLKIYIDGTERTLSFTGTIAAAGPDLSGANAYIGYTSSAFDGGIQDVRIYNSSVGASDIATIYQGGTYTTNMVHQYKLMEGVGVAAADTGSNPMNGTISGATWSTTGNNSIQTDFGRGALTLAPNTTNAKDGLWFGYDVNLYRSAAGTLTTDGALSVTGNLATTGTGQFARLGIGATPHATDLLTITSTDTTADSKAVNITHSGAITGTGYGLYVAKSGASTTNVGIYLSSLAATTNYGLQVAAMNGATSYGIDIGNLSGATANYGINIGTISSTGAAAAVTTGAISATGATAYQLNLGAISGANATSHTGIALGDISGTTPLAKGLSLGTLTGGTTSNYQINTGTLTKVASATNAQLNLGVVSGDAASSTNYGINIGAVSGTGTVNYGLYVGAVSGATANYGAIFAGGNVGIGITAPTAPLHIASSAANYLSMSGNNAVALTTASYYNFNIIPAYTADVTGSDAPTLYGLYFSPSTSGTLNTSGIVNMRGLVAIPTLGGTVTAVSASSTLQGIQSLPIMSGAGTFPSVQGVRASYRATGASAVITNGYSVYIPNASATSSGTITNNYGLYIENQTTGGTLNYSIYSAGGQNYLAGNLGLSGATTPTNALSLGGNAARIIWMERRTTSNTAGNGLTVQAGSATLSATDKNGGNLTLMPGIATGDGSAAVILQAIASGQGAGTTDRNPATVLTINGNSADLAAGKNLTLSGASSGTITLQTAAVAGTYSLTLPTDDGLANQYLQTNGSGVLSWANGTVAGSDTQVQFNDGGSAFGGDAGFTYAKASDALTVTGYIITPYIKPSADATTAFQIRKNDGTSVIFNVDSTNSRVGINNNAPAASLSVTQATLGSEAFRIESTATNDDPNYRIFQNRVATTDATVTTIQSFALTAGHTYQIESRIVARDTGGSATGGASYIRRATYLYTIAGGTQLIGSVQDTYTAEADAAWDCTITSTASAQADVRVTGKAATNITWHSTTIVQDLQQ